MDKLIDFETSHVRAVARIKELTEHSTDDGQEFNHLANWLRFTDVPGNEFMIGNDSSMLRSSTGFRSLLVSLSLRMSEPITRYSFAVFDERPRLCFLPSHVLDVTVLSDYLDSDEQDSWGGHCDLSLITFLPDAYAFTNAVEARYLKNRKNGFVHSAAVHGVGYAVAQSKCWPAFSESWVTELAEEISESAKFYAQQKTARSAA